MIVDKHPVADNIRRIRESLGLSQTELARRLGVKIERVSNWECKENNPTAAWLPAIADTLHCSIDELFGHEIKLSDTVRKLNAVCVDLDDLDVETLLVTAEAMRQRHQ